MIMLKLTEIIELNKGCAMKKQENSRFIGIWDKITAGYAIFLTAFFLTYVLLFFLGSDLIVEPALALVNMSFLLVGMIYFILLRYVTVKKHWRYLLLTAISLNFLLIFLGGLLLLASAT